MAFGALEVLVNCSSNWETFTFSVLASRVREITGVERHGAISA